MDRLDIGTKVRITSKTGPHGFEIGEVVTLAKYDADGDPIFTNGPRRWWVSDDHYTIYIDDEDLPARLEAAYEVLGKANFEVQSVSLLLLAKRARTLWPTCTALILCDSDQGPTADLESVEVDGEHIDSSTHEEWDDYHDTNLELAWNLDSHGGWGIFGDPEYNRRWAYRLPIDPILEYAGDYVRYAEDLTRAKAATAQ